MQHGRAILYINGASGTISGNKVYDFQKNGIEISGLNADASAPSSDKTSATIANNVVTGRGHIDYIAQNGIVIRGGASATVKDNTVSDLWYTGPADTEATGLLNYEAGKITVSGNTFVDTEVRIDGAVTANVLGHSTKTIRPHGVRIDLLSDAKPAAQAVLGAKLDWKIKVDGSVRLHIKQGFSDHAVVLQALQDRLGPAHGQGLRERPPRPHGPRPLLIHASNTQRALAHFGPGLFPVLSRRRRVPLRRLPSCSPGRTSTAKGGATADTSTSSSQFGGRAVGSQGGGHLDQRGAQCDESDRRANRPARRSGSGPPARSARDRLGSAPSRRR